MISKECNTHGKIDNNESSTPLTEPGKQIIKHSSIKPATLLDNIEK